MSSDACNAVLVPASYCEPCFMLQSMLQTCITVVNCTQNQPHGELSSVLCVLLSMIMDTFCSSAIIHLHISKHICMLLAV